MSHQKTTDEEMIVAIVVAGWLEDRTVSEAARQTSSVSEQEGELKVGGRQCIIVFPPPWTWQRPSTGRQHYADKCSR